MPEQKWREAVAERARSWLGASETNGKHRDIIDLYNSYSPHPRGYAVTYTDPWCAAFVSAVMISLGLDDIAPPECSCPVMIARYKALGRWMEDDGYTPQAGDVIFYDWDDSGAGDCTGEAGHVGIVAEVAGRVLTVIEGNMSDAVGERTITVDARYIRGYGIPDYGRLSQALPASMIPADAGGDAARVETSAAAPVPEPGRETWPPLPALRAGDTGAPVTALQALLLWRGERLPRYGADGDFGAETESAVRSLRCRCALPESGAADEAVWAALTGKEKE